MNEKFIRILWSGTSQKETGYKQKLVWNSKIKVKSGTVHELKLINFQHPYESAVIEDEHTVSWKSATAGNEAGVILKINGNGSTHLQFTSIPLNFSCSLDNVF